MLLTSPDEGTSLVTSTHPEDYDREDVNQTAEPVEQPETEPVSDPREEDTDDAQPATDNPDVGYC